MSKATIPNNCQSVLLSNYTVVLRHSIIYSRAILRGDSETNYTLTLTSFIDLIKWYRFANYLFISKPIFPRKPSSPLIVFIAVAPSNLIKCDCGRSLS